jgi:hypothetical protein
MDTSATSAAPSLTGSAFTGAQVIDLAAERRARRGTDDPTPPSGGTPQLALVDELAA